MANNAPRPTRIRFIVAALLCLVGLSSAAHAANDCPWLTEATASGLIGAEAVGSFTAPSGAQPAVCTFAQRSDGMTRTLTITVELTTDAHTRMSSIARACGAGAATLNAIGNEAVCCAADLRRGELGERAIGRVRNQVFTIDINSTLKDDPILTRDALKARIYTAAEQVAGNLF
ncbi:MAG: hypothetical protein ABSE96_13410 [Terracidiphilus sp.]|jgi:hypothetical protein